MVATCGFLDKLFQTYDESFLLQQRIIFEGLYSVVFLDEVPDCGYSAFNMANTLANNVICMGSVFTFVLFD